MSKASEAAARNIANIFQIGEVTEVDNAAGTVRVRIGDLDSPPLSVMQIRSGTIKLHWMPSVGEQVTVMAPGGDLSRGFVGGSVPISGNTVAPDAGSPTMDLGGGTLRVVGTLHVDGDVEVTGNVTASGVSLVTHVHPGVAPGGASTGEPQ